MQAPPQNEVDGADIPDVEMNLVEREPRGILNVRRALDSHNASLSDLHMWCQSILANLRMQVTSAKAKVSRGPLWGFFSPTEKERSLSFWGQTGRAILRQQVLGKWKAQKSVSVTMGQNSKAERTFQRWILTKELVRVRGVIGRLRLLDGDQVEYGRYMSRVLGYRYNVRYDTFGAKDGPDGGVRGFPKKASFSRRLLQALWQMCFVELQYGYVTRDVYFKELQETLVPKDLKRVEWRKKCLAGDYRNKGREDAPPAPWTLNPFLVSRYSPEKKQKFPATVDERGMIRDMPELHGKDVGDRDEKIITRAKSYGEYLAKERRNITVNSLIKLAGDILTRYNEAKEASISWSNYVKSFITTKAPTLEEKTRAVTRILPNETVRLVFGEGIDPPENQIFDHRYVFAPYGQSIHNKELEDGITLSVRFQLCIRLAGNKSLKSNSVETLASWSNSLQLLADNGYDTTDGKCAVDESKKFKNALDKSSVLYQAIERDSGITEWTWNPSGSDPRQVDSLNTLARTANNTGRLVANLLRYFDSWTKHVDAEPLHYLLRMLAMEPREIDECCEGYFDAKFGNVRASIEVIDLTADGDAQEEKVDKDDLDALAEDLVPPPFIPIAPPAPLDRGGPVRDNCHVPEYERIDKRGNINSRCPNTYKNGRSIGLGQEECRQYCYKRIEQNSSLDGVRRSLRIAEMGSELYAKPMLQFLL